MVALAEVSSRAAVSEVWFSSRLVLGDTQKLSSATRNVAANPTVYLLVRLTTAAQTKGRGSGIIYNKLMDDPKGTL